jgi:ABC-type cobalamin/Fe3+-siderophores transport system ATPase subunit
MIEKLLIKNDDLPIKYWKEVNALKDLTEITFSPDINVIVGPNAIGKSTLLKLLKIAFHCSYSYYSCITQRSIEDNSKKDFSFLHAKHTAKKPSKHYGGYDVIHDGNPVFSFDSSFDIGGTAGGLDNDFMMEQVSSMFATKTGSTGQKILHRIFSVCEKAVKNNEIDDKIGENVNDLWLEYKEASQRIINNPTLPKSKKTILFDEPTQNLDIINEMDFWSHMNAGAKRFQFIIATHSVGILSNFTCDVRVIELKSGFVKDMVTSLNLLNLNRDLHDLFIF